MNNYKKTNKDEVFNFMKTNRLTIDFYDVLFSANILSYLMGISKYAARKHLRELKAENKIEYKCQVHHEYGEYGRIEYTSPPICGYTVVKNFLSEAERN